MLTNAASIVALVYLGFGLMGIIGMMSMPNYRVAMALDSYEGVSFVSLLYYACVAVLALQHPGTAASILIGIIAVPIVIGWVRGEQPTDTDTVKVALASGFVQLAIQAACIAVMVF